MNKIDFANNLFEAIDTIVDKKLKALKFDRCILGHVKEGPDQEGRYTIVYQDRQFSAVPLGLLSPQIGVGAYVLIPNNDFAQQAFILCMDPLWNEINSKQLKDWKLDTNQKMADLENWQKEKEEIISDLNNNVESLLSRVDILEKLHAEEEEEGG